MAMRVRNGAKLANAAPEPPYCAIDQQSPIAGRAPVRRAPVSVILPALVEQRAGLAMPAHDRQRIVHHLGHFRRHGGRLLVNNSTGSRVPHGAMRRAGRGLILRGEQGLDLVVGLVDGARSGGLPRRSCLPASRPFRQTMPCSAIGSSVRLMHVDVDFPWSDASRPGVRLPVIATPPTRLQRYRVLSAYSGSNRIGMIRPKSLTPCAT